MDREDRLRIGWAILAGAAFFTLLMIAAETVPSSGVGAMAILGIMGFVIVLVSSVRR